MFLKMTRVKGVFELSATHNDCRAIKPVRRPKKKGNSYAEYEKFFFMYPFRIAMYHRSSIFEFYFRMEADFGRSAMNPRTDCPVGGSVAGSVGWSNFSSFSSPFERNFSPHFFPLLLLLRRAACPQNSEDTDFRVRYRSYYHRF